MLGGGCPGVWLPGSRPVSESGMAGKMNILIVDDEEMACQGMVRRIQRMAFEEIGEIYCASSAAEALEIVKRTPEMWIVITDIYMPQMTGLEMIRAMHDCRVCAHYIIFSAYDNFSYAQEAIKLGAVDYLLKPCSYGELRDTLANILQHFTKRENYRGSPREQARELLMMLCEGRVRAEDYGQQLGELLQACGMAGHTGYAVLFAQKEMPSWGEAGEAGLPLQQKNACLLNVENEAALESIARGIRLPPEGAGRIAVSSIGPASRCGQLLSEAEQLLAESFFRPPGALLFCHREREKPACYELGQVQMREMSDLLRTMDLLRLEKMLDDIFSPLALQRYPAHALAQMYDTIAGIFCGAKIGLGIQSGWQVKSWRSFASLQEMKQTLMDILRAHQKQLNDRLDQPAVEMARQFIEEHLDQEISMAEIANRLNMSYSYFSRIFSASVGRSFSDYLYHVRMEEASRRLLRGESVSSVSQAVGYQQTKNFSRAFRRYFGVAPSMWIRLKS